MVKNLTDMNVKNVHQPLPDFPWESCQLPLCHTSSSDGNRFDLYDQVPNSYFT